MKLKFDKSGRRFFFLTFCVRGRRPILSKLITGRDEKGKLTASVVQTALGEKIAALWRGVHARHLALTASNFIVMPDHVHLLLIVNYPLEPAFDILDWFQHFMRSDFLTRPEEGLISCASERQTFSTLSCSFFAQSCTQS